MKVDREEVSKIISELLNNPTPDEYSLNPDVQYYLCLDKIERYIEKRLFETIGWAYGHACGLMDTGVDIRTIEVPKVLDEYIKDFN